MCITMETIDSSRPTSGLYLTQKPIPRYWMNISPLIKHANKNIALKIYDYEHLYSSYLSDFTDTQTRCQMNSKTIDFMIMCTKML